MNRRGTRTGRLRRAAITAAAVLALGACSTEDIAEKAAEKAIEQQLEENGQSGDVDVDLNGGNIKVETPDGSAVINVDENGEGNIQFDGSGTADDVNVDLGGDDGQTVISTPDGQMVFGSDELPDGFPGDVPVPDGLTIDASTATTTGDGQMFMVSGALDGDFDGIADDYLASLAAAGFEQQAVTDTPDGSYFTYSNADWDVSGGISPDTNDGEGSIFSITVVSSTSG